MISWNIFLSSNLTSLVRTFDGWSWSPFQYSAVPNKRAVWNKQAGGTFFENSINEQSGINEEGGFFKNSDKRAGWNKKAGWNIEKFTNITYLGYQVPIYHTNAKNWILKNVWLIKVRIITYLPIISRLIVQNRYIIN